MIQRIQSLYLLLTALLSALLFSGSILNFTNNAGTTIQVTFSSLMKLSSGQPPETVDRLILLTVVLILIPLVALVVLLLFKKRAIQIKLTILLIALVSFLILACIHSSYLIMSKYPVSFIPGFRVFVPVLMLIFSILALRGIKKDDDLVKSYDRIR